MVLLRVSFLNKEPVEEMMLRWRMRCQKGVVLTFLSARVELDEKDESFDALIFWWER